MLLCWFIILVQMYNGRYVFIVGLVCNMIHRNQNWNSREHQSVDTINLHCVSIYRTRITNSPRTKGVFLGYYRNQLFYYFISTVIFYLHLSFTYWYFQTCTICVFLTSPNVAEEFNWHMFMIFLLLFQLTLDTMQKKKTWTTQHIHDNVFN